MAVEQVTFVCNALHDHVRRVRGYFFQMADTLENLQGTARDRHLRQFVQDASLLLTSLQRLYKLASDVKSLGYLNLEQIDAEISRLRGIVSDHAYQLDHWG